MNAFLYAGAAPMSVSDPSGLAFAPIDDGQVIGAPADPNCVKGCEGGLPDGPGEGSGGLRSVLKGLKAEQAVSRALDIPRNINPFRESIPGSGPGGVRYPDLPPSLTGSQLVEVKNVNYLRETPQLRDYAAYYDATGVPTVIYTDAIGVSRRVQLLIDRGAVIVKDIPWQP